MTKSSSDHHLARVTVALTLAGGAVDAAHLEPFGLPKPTHAGHRGDPQLPGLPSIRENFWTIEVEGRFDSIDEAIVRLLDQLEPFRDQILNAVRVTSAEAGFLVSVSIDEERPLYCLSPATLRRLAGYSLEFCLDIFDYSS